MENIKKEVRARAGRRVGIIGIAANALLFVMKFIVGSAVGSLAIVADAFNNLSDAGSSAVSYISFRIAAKPADRHHPFGHARIEYIASMIVAFLILLVGFELGADALGRILSPGAAAVFSAASVAVLAVSIAAKLALALLNRRVGKRIDSEVMRATAIDCLSDVLSSSAVLASTIILRVSGIDIDAFVGLAVSALILIAGVRILLETKNSILGEPPVREVTESIRALIAGYPAVLGIHDMLIHSYGPGHSFATFHAEVDGRGDFFDAHDMIDEIERRLREELDIVCTIHMDPIMVDDPMTDRLRQSAEALAREIDPALRVHDFRLVTGPTHSNLIFDLEAPFELLLKDDELIELMKEKIQMLNPSYYAVVAVDRG